MIRVTTVFAGRIRLVRTFLSVEELPADGTRFVTEENNLHERMPLPGPVTLPSIPCAAHASPLIAQRSSQVTFMSSGGFMIKIDDLIKILHSIKGVT